MLAVLRVHGMSCAAIFRLFALCMCATYLDAEGNLYEDVLVRYIMSLHYGSIFLAPDSLMQRLRDDFPVCSLHYCAQDHGLVPKSPYPVSSIATPRFDR